MNILIVDDDDTFRKNISKALIRRGYGVHSAKNGEGAVSLALARPFHVAFVDMKMPGMNGINVIKELKEIDPKLKSIVLTGYGSIINAVEAVKTGAYNYLTKPCSIDDIEDIIVKVANETISEKEENKGCQENYCGIIGKSKGMQGVVSIIQKIKDSNLPVLICGESGTGKELTARAIHFDSVRKNKPFIAVNCASLKPELLENEFFGHVRGGFTGATDNKDGLLKIADGGTVFIDEIGDMNLVIQASLLRFLETWIFRPIGSTKEIKVDVRIIAAINKDIEEEVRAKRFRHDLYYRLNVCRIDIPPLRDRKDDIPILVSHFLATSMLAKEKSITISNRAVEALTSCNWTGNVRELFNTLSRALLLCNDGIVTSKAIASIISLKSNTSSKVSTLDEIEKRCLLENLNDNRWNITRTAKTLGIDRRTLQRKMARYNINRTW